MKTAIIVDSTAYLPMDLANHQDVYIIYQSLHFSDGTIVEDSADCQVHAQFYQRLKEQTQLPTTSQPSPEAYYQLLEQIVERGYDSVICIHLSSGISGTYQSAHLYAQDFQEQLDIRFVDSKAASAVMEYLVSTTLTLLSQNYSLDAIMAALDWIVSHSQVYLLVEDLNNLVKGGRLSTGSALLGSMLKIRPLLYFDDNGEIIVYEKMRTNKKVYRRWLEFIDDWQLAYPQGFAIALAHADCLDDLEEVQALVQAHAPDIEILMRTLGPAVGTHTGQGSKGIGLLPRLPLDFFENRD